MRITRKEILKAIRTEKLKGGMFIDESTGADWNKCKVCAVGAVLRLKGIEGWDIDESGWQCIGNEEFDFDGTELRNSLREKNYMAALSIKFENLYDKYGGGKRTKEKLARFIKANFPKTINVNI